MENTLLIFDCYGVITSEVAPRWFKMRFDDLKAKELKDYYFKGADLGLISANELFSKISNDLGIPVTTIISEFKTLFYYNQELIDFIKSLKGKYHLALLSNVVRGLNDILFSDKNLLNDLFDMTFFSYEYNLAKPDLKFYQLPIDAFKPYNINKIYFFDDNEKNINGLEKLNIIGHKFVSNTELFDFLAKEGIHN